MIFAKKQDKKPTMADASSVHPSQPTGNSAPKHDKASHNKLIDSADQKSFVHGTEMSDNQIDQKKMHMCPHCNMESEVQDDPAEEAAESPRMEAKEHVDAMKIMNDMHRAARSKKK